MSYTRQTLLSISNVPQYLRYRKEGAHLDSSYPLSFLAIRQCPPFFAYQYMATLLWLALIRCLRTWEVQVGAGNDGEDTEDAEEQN